MGKGGTRSPRFGPDGRAVARRGSEVRRQRLMGYGEFHARDTGVFVVPWRAGLIDGFRLDSESIGGTEPKGGLQRREIRTGGPAAQSEAL